MDEEGAAAAFGQRYPSYKIRSIAMGIAHRVRVMAESTGIEPVRPEGTRRVSTALPYRSANSPIQMARSTGLEPA